MTYLDSDYEDNDLPDPMDSLDFDEEWPEEFDDSDVPTLDVESEICPFCNGSGEGHYEGSTCSNCKGKGEVRC
jgi:RecJ-like exonuclease